MTPGRPSSGRPAAPRSRRIASSIGIGFAAVLATAAGTMAAPITNPVATFSGLDKITARLTNFDVYVGETVQFGSLQITPRVCYTRPASEQQRTSVFVEVDQVNLKGASKRVFTGWMFADSPALNAVDNPVYDFWLVDCKQHSDVPPPAETNPVPPPVPVEAIPADPPAEPAPDAATPTAPAAAPVPTPDATAAPPAPTQIENGSIITLLDPTPAAEAAPDARQ